ncbi:hypothetical protein QTL86_12785 [Cellulosilyticum sp. ST5]|uniref:hypothetical protein n=1 Tax=Cellulosilyticum sp. ST5 TaxID=3055805 RepID=UPI003977291C
MANVIQYSTIIQNELDKMAIQESCTGWMEANAGQVKYNGGKEVKIPVLSTQGLADYKRANNEGFVQGGVNLSYKTYEMTQDRGRAFGIDANDVDETGFVLTASSILGEFQRTNVIPEIDAYRLSKLATIATSASMGADGYTPAAATIVQKIKEGIKAIRQKGYNGPLVCQITYDALMEVELYMAGKLASQTFSVGGFNTTCPSIDGVPLLQTPENRMYTAITLYDGETTGQEAGGYIKATTAKEVNFIISATSTPLAISKQDSLRIFDPTVNQKFSGWAMDYRRYHDLWVKDQQKKTLWVNTK